jgi:hypothetical protein
MIRLTNANWQGIASTKFVRLNRRFHTSAGVYPFKQEFTHQLDSNKDFTYQLESTRIEASTHQLELTIPQIRHKEFTYQQDSPYNQSVNSFSYESTSA